MTLSDDIDIARKRLEQATRHLLGVPEMFGKYNGLYQGNKISMMCSKYLEKCKGKAIIARKKLEALERKLCNVKKNKRR